MDRMTVEDMAAEQQAMLAFALAHQGEPVGDVARSLVKAWGYLRCVMTRTIEPEESP